MTDRPERISAPSQGKDAGDSFNRTELYNSHSSTVHSADSGTSAHSLKSASDREANPPAYNTSQLYGANTTLSGELHRGDTLAGGNHQDVFSASERPGREDHQEVHGSSERLADGAGMRTEGRDDGQHRLHTVDGPPSNDESDQAALDAGLSTAATQQLYGNHFQRAVASSHSHAGDARSLDGFATQQHAADTPDSQIVGAGSTGDTGMDGRRTDASRDGTDRGEGPNDTQDRASYLTRGGKEVQFSFPSDRLYEHSTPALKDQAMLNQQALLDSLDGIKQGEFPRLAFHGTDEAGKQFIESTRTSQDKMGHATQGEIWTSINRIEGVDPKSYLNDLQHAIAHSIPGQTAVIDAGKALNWTRSIPDFPSRTFGVAPWGGSLGESTEEIIGAKSDNIGKATVGFTPETYDQRVLGFVDRNALRRPALGEHRNELAETFDIQKATVDTLELTGILKRK